MDINADIGEGYDDVGLMPYLTRASIACGGHTGDAHSMDAALALAAEYGVAVGAHPSYPDRKGFGRREWVASPEQIAQWVTEQTEALAEIAASRFEAMKLRNITAHVGDGSKGWPHAAPYERIIVTAAAPEIPQALLAQLAIGGLMIIPVGLHVADQFLLRLTRVAEDEVRKEVLTPVRFVPLVV